MHRAFAVLKNALRHILMWRVSVMAASPAGSKKTLYSSIIRHIRVAKMVISLGGPVALELASLIK
jgi:hypothetical protein